MLGISVTLTKAVFVYLCFCVFVFACQTNGNFVFEALGPLPFEKYSICQTYLQLWKKMYSCICKFVFVYLHIRHQRTLFLMSSYHYLFKNITYVRHICNFDRNCICVFVYLCICIYVFAHQIVRSIIFEVLIPSPFQKYSPYCAYVQL